MRTGTALVKDVVGISDYNTNVINYHKDALGAQLFRKQIYSITITLACSYDYFRDYFKRRVYIKMILFLNERLPS